MLEAISPIDGRYASKTRSLSSYFSELALIRTRVRIEIEYFIALTRIGLPQLGELSDSLINALRDISGQFSLGDGQRVKEIERRTNHDVKAVEYFIKEAFDKLELAHQKEWVHFALTSQDINNTAIPLLLKEALHEEIVPQMKTLLVQLQKRSREWNGVPMLAHTHGQPASPTTVGKEIRVFTERLEAQLSTLQESQFYAKFGGATGNFNAHLTAIPDVDWRKFADAFVEGLGLNRLQTTTQIDHYDHIAETMHNMIRLSTILIDLCRDLWMYISMDYFTQKTVDGEVGSSTMPHKVNPIDFENAEGNLGLAIALFDHLAVKLPVSRLQRDLTDSTVLRNIGVPFGHFVIALHSVSKGLDKLHLNGDKLNEELEANWMVTAEAIQTILRREGVEQPYELLKSLTRGKQKVDRQVIRNFIDQLPVSEEVKKELRQISPFTYTGYA